MRSKKILALLLCASMAIAGLAPGAGLADETELGQSEAETEMEQVTEFQTEKESAAECPETEIHIETEAEPEADPEPETAPETEPETAPCTEKETEIWTETEADTMPETEADTMPETESETEAETVLETNPSETETEAIPETELQIETEPGTEPAPETASDPEPEQEGEPKTRAGNERKEEAWEETEPDVNGLTGTGIPRTDAGEYFWDASWYLPADFRFTKVEKKYAIAEPDSGTAAVYGSTSEDAQIVGELPYFSLAYVLEEVGDWTYIESDAVRGFVKSEELQIGEFTDVTVEAIGEPSFVFGLAYVAASDNEAFTYTHTTVKDVLASKQYGMALYSCGILEYADPSARAIGMASSGDLMYILAEADNGWYFVESGDVRGFIDPSLVLVGKTADGLVEALGEDDIPLVDQLVEPKDNKSCYFTLTSVQIAGSNIGADIAGYALSFVGNLGYVWGGTSLQTGADCSGFTQAVFADYGVYIPRTAQQQGANGQLVSSLADAQVGDIVYYASGPHVGIYIGNGMVVQCSGGSANTSSNPGKGPTVSPVNYMTVTSIRRYLIQTESSGNSTSRLDLTYYSREEMELIWAIVAQEDNGSYEGALAVISSAMNRTESPRWSYCGGNALAQLTAQGQYCYSLDGYWRARLHGNVPSYVVQAVNDCLKKGIRNHNYTCFRSTRGKTTGTDAVQIGGNWYFGQ